MTVRTSSSFDAYLAALSDGFVTLPDKPAESADATLRALWHLAAGSAKSLEAAQESALPELDSKGHARLATLLEHRKQGIPLAHLTGRQRFMGLDMLAGPQALIPRAETELLGRTACAALQEIARSKAEPKVLDLCTGSGNLALALAHAVRHAEVFASDLAADAIDLARKNAAHLGLTGRVDWRVGDLLSPLPLETFAGAFDLIVCNPPYISSPKLPTMPGEIIGHEPEMAFDGGPLGIRILQRLIREAPEYLAVTGTLAFEVGYGQGPAAYKRLASSQAFRELHAIPDSGGEIRVLVARGRSNAILST
jgi:release factor glutamine methyltransferase